MKPKYKIIAVEISPEYDGDERIEMLNECVTNIHEFDYAEERYEGQHFDLCATMCHYIEKRRRS